MYVAEPDAYEHFRPFCCDGLHEVNPLKSD